jgi:hypothetical protein
MTKTIKKTRNSQKTSHKNKTVRIQTKQRGGNCDEFDKKEARNKNYKLLKNYEFPSNFIIHTGESTIECDLGEPKEFTYIIQAHTLKHIDSFGKECNAGLPEIHIHDIYNPYSKDPNKIEPTVEQINNYKTMLQSHIEFITPFVTTALSQPYIQETLYHCSTGNNSDGNTKKSVFLYNIPITIYFEQTSVIYAMSGSWRKIGTTKYKDERFNDELYELLSMEKPELKIDDLVFDIFQFVKTKLPDIPPFWYRCLKSCDYPDEGLNEDILCI